MQYEVRFSLSGDKDIELTCSFPKASAPASYTCCYPNIPTLRTVLHEARLPEEIADPENSGKTYLATAQQLRDLGFPIQEPILQSP